MSTHTDCIPTLLLLNGLLPLTQLCHKKYEVSVDVYNCTLKTLFADLCVKQKPLISLVINILNCSNID